MVDPQFVKGAKLIGYDTRRTHIFVPSAKEIHFPFGPILEINSKPFLATGSNYFYHPCLMIVFLRKGHILRPSPAISGPQSGE